MSVLQSPAWSRVLPTGQGRENHPAYWAIAPRLAVGVVALAKKSYIRIAVLTLSHFVFVRASAYERVAWSERCRPLVAYESEKDVVVRSSELGEVVHAEGPRQKTRTAWSQITSLGRQHANFYHTSE